jgi:hypothetical protein
MCFNTLCEGQTFLIFSGICPILNLQGCKMNRGILSIKQMKYLSEQFKIDKVSKNSKRNTIKNN